MRYPEDLKILKIFFFFTFFKKKKCLETSREVVRHSVKTWKWWKISFLSLFCLRNDKTAVFPKECLKTWKIWKIRKKKYVNSLENIIYCVFFFFLRIEVMESLEESVLFKKWKKVKENSCFCKGISWDTLKTWKSWIFF